MSGAFTCDETLDPVMNPDVVVAAAAVLSQLLTERAVSTDSAFRSDSTAAVSVHFRADKMTTPPTHQRFTDDNAPPETTRLTQTAAGIRLTD